MKRKNPSRRTTGAAAVGLVYGLAFVKKRLLNKCSRNELFAGCASTSQHTQLYKPRGKCALGREDNPLCQRVESLVSAQKNEMLFGRLRFRRNGGLELRRRRLSRRLLLTED